MDQLTYEGPEFGSDLLPFTLDPPASPCSDRSVPFAMPSLSTPCFLSLSDPTPHPHPYPLSPPALDQTSTDQTSTDSHSFVESFSIGLPSPRAASPMSVFSAQSSAHSSLFEEEESKELSRSPAPIITRSCLRLVSRIRGSGGKLGDPKVSRKQARLSQREPVRGPVLLKRDKAGSRQKHRPRYIYVDMTGKPCRDDIKFDLECPKRGIIGRDLPFSLLQQKTMYRIDVTCIDPELYARSQVHTFKLHCEQMQDVLTFRVKWYK